MTIILKTIDKYDDPVGNWYLCECGEEIFFPNRSRKWNGNGNYFPKYCPFCGKEIKYVL